MSGFFPGLSGLMVKETISYFQEVREVNVGLLQNTNAKTGLSCILDMLKIISQSVAFQDNIIPGFTKKKEMYFSNHNKEKEVAYRSFGKNTIKRQFNSCADKLLDCLE